MSEEEFLFLKKDLSHFLYFFIISKINFYLQNSLLEITVVSEVVFVTFLCYKIVRIIIEIQRVKKHEI